MKKLVVMTSILSVIGFSALAKHKPASIKITPVVVKADSMEFKDYYGDYKMNNNQFVEKLKVFFKGGDLYGQASGYPEIKLVRKKDDEFEDGSFGAQIIFIRNGSNIDSVKIVVQGKEFIGTKL